MHYTHSEMVENTGMMDGGISFKSMLHQLCSMYLLCLN